MRHARQEKILELISLYRIETQEELARRLQQAGFSVTQATVSRDIKDLQLVKTARGGSKSCYSLPERAASSDRERFEKVLRETVRSVRAAENLIVVKTLTGCANAAAEAIDNFDNPELVGTIAGDNTIFLVIDAKENVPGFMEHLNRIIG